MSKLGVNLRVMIGPEVAVPLSSELVKGLKEVNVDQTDQSPSGFQITFQISRKTGAAGIVPDYAFLLEQEIKPGYRVSIIVEDGVIPTAIMDGIITHQELIPSAENGTDLFIVTGEDVSVLMDITEETMEYPAMPASIIAETILAKYMAYRIEPEIIPPPLEIPPDPLERVPVQRSTDRAYLQYIAKNFGYVFYIQPQAIPPISLAYLGPPKRLGIPHPALIVNQGPHTNVNSIKFNYDSLAPTRVTGFLQDGSKENIVLPVIVPLGERVPPLAAEPAMVAQALFVRNSLPENYGGISISEAEAYALGRANASTDAVLVVEGELDYTRYGHMLMPYGLVGIQGAGVTHDGLYYVKRVVHQIKPAEGVYKQAFTLTREGYMEDTPEVVPDID